VEGGTGQVSRVLLGHGRGATWQGSSRGEEGEVRVGQLHLRPPPRNATFRGFLQADSRAKRPRKLPLHGAARPGGESFARL